MFGSVVIVGGGPVGLYTALLLREKYPYAKIVLFEKRAQYTRNHRVRIDRLQLTQPRLILQGTIPIKEAEEQLKKRLVNVHVVQKEIRCINDILVMISDVQTIIFADGAHSKARDLYFLGECSRIDYAHGCSIRYRGVKHHLSLEHNYRVSKLINCHVHESTDGESVHITLISQKPMTSEEAHQKMCVVVNARRVELGENVFSEPVINTFPLQLYTATTVKTKRHGRHLFLVGDAAIGLPYQCGLRAGLQCARALVESTQEYTRQVVEIQDSYMTAINLRNTFLGVYLNYASFWKGTVFEWQRWSRPFEHLLMTTNNITDKHILHCDETKNRFLILDRLLN